MARGVSTVLDVAICLLLIGAAVATLALGTVPAESSDVDADPDAMLLSTVTAPSSMDDGAVHATLATHLAIAALYETTIDGTALFDSAYVPAALDEVERVLEERVAVSARWEPYEDATFEGRVDVGTPPPSDATVAATTVSVPVVSSATRPGSFALVANDLAVGFLERLFPPRRTKQALVDPRTATETADRYRSIADALGVDIEDRIVEADSEGANRVLASALAHRIEPELRDGFETPTAAFDETTPEVEIVVRRWEP